MACFHFTQWHLNIHLPLVIPQGSMCKQENYQMASYLANYLFCLLIKVINNTHYSFKNMDIHTPLIFSKLFIGKICVFHVDFLREIYLTSKA